jgi:hypothetical protein
MIKLFCFMVNIILTKYTKPFAIIWTLFVLLLCSFPGQYIPVISWLEILSFDKWVHMSIFFILTFSWMNYYYHQNSLNKKNKYLIVWSCIFYGGILEYLQYLIFSHRSADYLDFIANSVGSILALLLFKTLYQLLHKVFNCN